MAFTAAEQAELDSLDKELGGGDTPAPTPKGLSTADQAELDSLNKELGAKNTSTPMRYLKATARGVDYARATTTAPLLAMALDKLTGKHVYDEAEDRAAMAGDKPYPSSAELFKRAGMPDGYSLSDAVKSPLAMTPGIGPALGEIPALQYQPKGKGKWWQPEKGGFFDPSIRGVLGGVTDAAIDPATYATFGGSQVAKAGVAAGKTSAADVLRSFLKFPSNSLTRTGNALYESGVKPLMQAVEEKGKSGADALDTLYQGVERTLPPAKPLPGVLEDVKNAVNDLGKAPADRPRVDMSKVTIPGTPVQGNPTQMRKQMVDNARALYNQRKQMYAKAGAENIDPFAAFEPYVNAVLDAVDKSRMTKEQGDRLISAGIDKYATRWFAPNGKPFGTVNVVKPTSPELASTWKSDVSKETPESVRQVVSNTNLGNELTKSLENGLRNETEATVERATPGAGKELSDLNASLGHFLDMRKAARAAAQSYQKKPLITAWDSALFGGSFGGPALAELLGQHVSENAPVWGLGVLGAKKALDFSRTTAFRTKTGSLLRSIGEDPILSPAIDNLSRRLAVHDLLKQKGNQ